MCISCTANTGTAAVYEPCETTAEDKDRIFFGNEIKNDRKIFPLFRFVRRMRSDAPMHPDASCVPDRFGPYIPTSEADGEAPVR